MAYNKAKEEYKWKVWKEQEEKKLRELGVSEEVIAELRDDGANCRRVWCARPASKAADYFPLFTLVHARVRTGTAAGGR